MEEEKEAASASNTGVAGATSSTAAEQPGHEPLSYRPREAAPTKGESRSGLHAQMGGRDSWGRCQK